MTSVVLGAGGFFSQPLNTPAIPNTATSRHTIVRASILLVICLPSSTSSVASILRQHGDNATMIEYHRNQWATKGLESTILRIRSFLKWLCPMHFLYAIRTIRVTMRRLPPIPGLNNEPIAIR